MKISISCLAGFLSLGLLPVQTYARDQASMTALMGQLTPSYVDKIKGNNDALKLLLLGPFEADWSKAKECLLFDKWPQSVKVKAPQHDVGLKLMAELVRMRSVICNGVATTTQTGIRGQLQNERSPLPELTSAFQKEAETGTDEQHFKPLTSTGAEKLTSDIDVASNGLNTEIGVRLFNAKFRTTLGVVWDPATVFDYNIYAADWIFPANFVEVKSGGATKLTPLPEQILVKDAGATPTDDQLLQTERAIIFEKAALMHLRRSCTLSEWNEYLKQRAGEGAKVVTLLQSVNTQFNAFSAEVTTQVVQLRRSIPPVQGSLWPSSYYEEALETRARNELYTTRLLRVKALRLSYKLLKEQTSKSGSDRQKMSLLAKQLTEALTEAIFFANEVYATEGATLHATQALQKVAKEKAKGNTLEVILTAPQYEQAFHENVGDALHSLNHYESTPAYAAYRAGKYIERMLIAGEVLARANPTDANYKLLKALADQAAKVKESPVGDDPVEIAKSFNTYSTVANLKLRAAILRFGAELPGKIRR
ncbi:hypothetical protein [Armatimonas sp.]|uniref:hypothetical protein n=1 Tax=Armatimonas sp. TaxID=1872638 RepID=UPI00286CD0F8|nr:hypothetical protein [Armatimonas sp.]